MKLLLFLLMTNEETYITVGLFEKHLYHFDDFISFGLYW